MQYLEQGTKKAAMWKVDCSWIRYEGGLCVVIGSEVLGNKAK